MNHPSQRDRLLEEAIASIMFSSIHQLPEDATFQEIKAAFLQVAEKIDGKPKRMNAAFDTLKPIAAVCLLQHLNLGEPLNLKKYPDRAYTILKQKYSLISLNVNLFFILLRKTDGIDSSLTPQGETKSDDPPNPPQGPRLARFLQVLGLRRS